MFKDYEYGFYGIVCSFQANYMGTVRGLNTKVLNRTDVNRQGKIENFYQQSHNSMKKQLPKIQTVVFIYGDYKECI